MYFSESYVFSIQLRVSCRVQRRSATDETGAEFDRNVVGERKAQDAPSLNCLHLLSDSASYF